MAERFEDIVISRFEASEADQDPTHKGIFSFRFLLSRSAPTLWVQIADAELGKGRQINWNLQHTGRAYSDRIVIKCAAGEAQKMKDALNEYVLPSVNQQYRRHDGVAEAHKAARHAQHQSLVSEAEKAIRDQK
jgi:hypothetical protein